MAVIEREITIMGPHSGGGSLNGFHTSNQKSTGYGLMENYDNDPLDRLDRAMSGKTEYYRKLETSKNLNLSDPFEKGVASSSMRTLVDSVGAGGEMVVREKSISDGGPSADSVPRAPEPHTSWRFYTSYDNGEWRRHAVPVFHSEEEVMSTTSPRSGGRLRTESLSGDGSSCLSLSPTFGLETSMRRMRVSRPSVYDSLQNRRRRNHEGVRRLYGPRSPEYILNSPEFLDPEERKKRYEVKDYMPRRRTEYGEKVIYPRATPEQSLTDDSSVMSKSVTSFKSLGSSRDDQGFEEVTRTVHSFNDDFNLFRDGGETVTVVREKEPVNDYGFQEKIIIPTKYRTDKIGPKTSEGSKVDSITVTTMQSVNQVRDRADAKGPVQLGSKSTTIVRENIGEPSASCDFDSPRFGSDYRSTQFSRSFDNENDFSNRSNRRVEKVYEYDNRRHLSSSGLKETNNNQEREVKVLVVRKPHSEIPPGLLQTQLHPAMDQPQTQFQPANDQSHTQFHPAMVQPQFHPAMVRPQPQFHPAMVQPQSQFHPTMVQPQFHPAMGWPQFQPSMAQTEFQSAMPQTQFDPSMAQLQFHQPMPQAQFHPAMQQTQFSHPSMAQTNFQPVQVQSQPTRPADVTEVTRYGQSSRSEQNRDVSELSTSSQKGSRADELANQVRSSTVSTMKQMENQMLEQMKSKCPEAVDVVNSLISGVGSDGTTVEKKESFGERVSLWQAGRPVEDKLKLETRFHTNDPIHGPQDFVEKTSISKGDEETPGTPKTPFLSPFIYPKMEFHGGRTQFTGDYPSYRQDFSDHSSRGVQQMERCGSDFPQMNSQGFYQPRLSSVFLPDERLMSARQVEGKSGGMPKEYLIDDIRQEQQGGRQDYNGDGRITTMKKEFIPEKKVESSTEKIIIPTKYAKKNMQQSSDDGGSRARSSGQSSQERVQDMSKFGGVQRSFDPRDPRRIEATSNKFASIPTSIFPESSTFEERLDVLDGRYDTAPREIGSKSAGHQDWVTSAAHVSRLNSVHGLGASGDWEFDMAVNEIPGL